MTFGSSSDGSPDHSFIGRTIQIMGELEGHENLTILGKLEGQLNLNGYHLTVGEGANIDADVRARVISINGHVTGTIRPSELLAIHAGGVASGQIFAPRLVTEDGAKLQGRFAIGMSPEGTSVTLPDFAGVRKMLEAELAGLTDEQLNFSAETPEWARWSIRRQVSHMANTVFVWLIGRWRDILWQEIRPNPELVTISLGEHGHDRMLDPERYRRIESLKTMIRRSHDLIREIVSRETAQSIKSKKLSFRLPADAKLGTSGESAKDTWLKFKPVHQNDVLPDPKNPDVWTITLEATIRHIYFEQLAHLRTVQRLKGLQGLPTVATVPREGYLTLKGFWEP